jgi:hypothetical protein
MTQFGALLTEDLADQEPTVAFVRLAAAAQQRDPVLCRATHEPLDRLDKGWLARHLVIESMPFGVELVVV